ncbi:NAD(P)/FAD-dependent oxidoreductase [Phycicoccus sp. BSK3Z-2]|uniref:NAD(P)/FAD-dependent oxidoreductase n=1 Tax=Phycicoccus avicenniae TaxID=2828860 RepID=A0A941D9T4_9MICO|nr:NAD(P)/FAD-dependent oxidoreductase [Phycicoccus avicenniae]MBR7744749.1 NAD(P)/FAD-dependent oxidoreductase [Phycicoccus avicenniae]
MSTPDELTRHDVDVVVLGAGSAAAALVGALAGEPRVVVMEDALVGGECPYDACVPSKGLLHDGALGRSWETAQTRRRGLVHHRDDGPHVDDLVRPGVELVRERGWLVDAHTVRSAHHEVRAEHVVLATGAAASLPPLDGLDDVRDRVWTSADALRASSVPARLAILGGGVIGCELSRIFSLFGSDVVVYEPEDHLFGTLAPEVSEAVEAAVRAAGTELLTGVAPTALRRHGDRVVVVDDAGGERHVDRVLVATGRTPRTTGIGIESLGLDPEEPLPLDDTGRVRVEGSVWAVGDVSGRQQYTHAANHHGRVVADHLTGSGRRRLSDVVDAACMFLDPPMMTVGPSIADTAGDDDVVWSVTTEDGVVRANTDERRAALAVAADRRTGTVLAAHGIGAGFDELVHAVVVAVDGRVPIDRMLESMVPFPTMGAMWRTALEDLAERTGPGGR